jgi:hypothetical protein
MKPSLYFLAVAQVLFVCSVFAASEDKNTTIPDMAMVKQYVTVVQEIEKNRNSKKPDWAVIDAQYELTLPVVKEIDAKYKTRYAEELPDALKKIAAGEKVKINGQVVGKGFQHITVLGIRQELDVMASASAEGRKVCAEKIATYFEVIRPTFARRDKGFFDGKKTLETAADKAMEQLAKADKGDLLIASRGLEDAIARTYALSMLYEIGEVEKLRDSDIAACDVKRVEAKMFYRIIQPRVEKRSPKTNEILLNTLRGSFGAMNAETVEKEITSGLGIKLR